MVEMWASIPGFVGVYEISVEGEVRRIATHGDNPQKLRRIVRPHQRNNYLAIDLSRDNERHREYVHRIVWSAFRGTIPKGVEINHIDGDKHNNRLDNFELVTRSANMKHCFKFLCPSLKRVQGVEHHKAKLTPDIVREIRRMRADGVDRSTIATTFGITKTAVYYIDIGKNWKHVT